MAPAIEPCKQLEKSRSASFSLYFILGIKQSTDLLREFPGSAKVLGETFERVVGPCYHPEQVYSQRFEGGHGIGKLTTGLA